jgi:hypothetical protein
MVSPIVIESIDPERVVPPVHMAEQRPRVA